MLASVLFFAVNVLVIRGLALQIPAIDGWNISLFRSIAGLLTVLLIFGSGGRLSLRRVFTRPLLVVRGILGTVGIVLFYVTVVHLGAGRAVIINLTYPMFAAVIAAIWLREPLHPSRLLWIAVGFGGLCLFLGGGDHHESGTLPYDLLGIAGAVVAAMVVVIIRRLHTSEHSSTIYSSQCVFCLLATLPIAAPGISAVPQLGWFALLGAGVVVALGQLTMTYSYRYLTVSKGASLQMLLPLSTAIGGFFLFGERFSLLELAGAGLTILSTVRILRQPQTPSRRPELSPPKSCPEASSP